VFIFLNIAQKSFGQVTISYPTSRAIFQRNNINNGTVYISGNYTTLSDRIEARAVARPMTQSQGNSTSWMIIQNNPINGFYYGALNLQGGWYDIEVRCMLGSTIIGMAAVQRVGVGEVFLIAGQSNATGDSYLASQGNYGPMANDDRVSIVNYNLNSTTNYGGITLPRVEFSHLDSTLNIAPFGTSAWCWGALGDTLVKRLNVPIAFFNAGASGSGLPSWNITADDSTATPSSFITYPRGMPYGRLRAALNFYIAQFGVRAVLWHQGETDNLIETTRGTYGQYLKNVITKSRLHSGKNNLVWLVSKASRFKGFFITNSRIWQPIIDAQNDVIGLNGTGQINYTTNVYEGPETDMLIGPNVRTSDSIHFVGHGHRLLAKVWSQKLSSTFFANSVPYLSIPPPNLTSSCNGLSALDMSVSNTYSNVIWTSNATANNNLSSSNSYTSSTGQFRAKVKDSIGNILISPQINVPNNFAGLIPIKSITSGTWHDGATWQCGRIPSSLDYVEVSSGHTVLVGGGLTARFKKITINGYLQFFLSSTLQN
jgi:Carbohydrate esterase, sialic acid-specific acetylesterase